MRHTTSWNHYTQQQHVRRQQGGATRWLVPFTLYTVLWATVMMAASLFMGDADTAGRIGVWITVFWSIPVSACGITFVCRKLLEQFGLEAVAIAVVLNGCAAFGAVFVVCNLLGLTMEVLGMGAGVAMGAIWFISFLLLAVITYGVSCGARKIAHLPCPSR